MPPGFWNKKAATTTARVVTRFGAHNLRHGLPSWLAESGTSPEFIQRMLRHSSKDMTMHYTHAQKAARQAQERYIAELHIASEHSVPSSRPVKLP
ncbi:MAG: tyrosine-type recombinase/integrase [Acidobacteria bacterium]|nr:tyrosine-type recombinase/integrase [Acidobacteriota bacterium]